MILQGKKAMKLNKNIAVNKRKNIKGVKGISTISNMSTIHMNTSVIPEYMHLILLGIVKRITINWIECKGPWCVKKFLTHLDNFLLNIRPPDTIERMPRSLAELNYYKATEFYNWLLFYSLPTMKNYLEDEYFQHWILLVIATHTLLKDKITFNEIEESEILLELFVSQIEKLYGEKELTYNSHNLLHLGLIVKRSGPLWASSAFAFENQNGILLKLIKGSKHIGQEVMNKLIIIQANASFKE